MPGFESFALSVTVQRGEAGHFSPGQIEQARQLLFVVFDDMTEHDWEHALGGLHVLAWHDDVLIGHGALVQRRLMHGTRVLRTGYVEGFAIHPQFQRRGIGGLMMSEIERAIVRDYDIGALGATDIGASFYQKRGWRLWRGALAALSPNGVIPTPEEAGSIHVFGNSTDLDFDGGLTCDFRDGDVW